MKKITNSEDLEKYLSKHSIFYRFGWLYCSQNRPHMEIFIDPAYQDEFTEGYADCVANGESEPRLD